MPSGRVDRDQYLDDWAGGLAIATLARRTDPRRYNARQKLISRTRIRVIMNNHGIKTTSILTLRTAEYRCPSPVSAQASAFRTSATVRTRARRGKILSKAKRCSSASWPEQASSTTPNE